MADTIKKIDDDTIEVTKEVTQRHTKDYLEKFRAGLVKSKNEIESEIAEIDILLNCLKD